MILKTNNNKAFTLVELLIVVAIIGILAGFLAPNFSEMIREARLRRAYMDMREYRKAALMFYKDFKRLPKDLYELDKYVTIKKSPWKTDYYIDKYWVKCKDGSGRVISVPLIGNELQTDIPPKTFKGNYFVFYKSAAIKFVATAAVEFTFIYRFPSTVETTINFVGCYLSNTNVKNISPSAIVNDSQIKIDLVGQGIFTAQLEYVDETSALSIDFVFPQKLGAKIFYGRDCIYQRSEGDPPLVKIFRTVYEVHR